MSTNHVIGKDDGLPWRITADLKNFKKTTMGKPIVMGRATHQSIGRVLPGRQNIVLTSKQDYQAQGCTVLHSLDAVWAHCERCDEVMIMGGAVLYEQVLSTATKLYLTEVHATVAGDTFLPKFDRAKWEEIAREDFQADEKNEFDYSFVVLDKK